MSQGLRVPHAKHFRHSDTRKLRRSRYMKKWFALIQSETTSTFSQAYAALVKVHNARLLTGLAVTAREPQNTVAPAITGTATTGNTVTCSQGTWTGTPTPTYAYQWYIGGLVVPGGTAATHVVAAGDVGHSLLCVVTATNALGSVTANSNSVPVNS